jgi:hypothetical protein
VGNLKGCGFRETKQFVPALKLRHVARDDPHAKKNWPANAWPALNLKNSSASINESWAATAAKMR